MTSSCSTPNEGGNSEPANEGNGTQCNNGNHSDPSCNSESKNSLSGQQNNGEQCDNSSANLTERGVVKWFNDAKGFGFITHSSGDDVFVHHTVIDSEGFRTLKDGEEVRYSMISSDKGLHATKVKRVNAPITQSLNNSPSETRVITEDSSNQTNPSESGSHDNIGTSHETVSQHQAAVS